MIDFLTITGFTTSLTYVTILSLFIVSVLLNQQRRWTLTLKITHIIPNLVDGTKRYQITLDILIIILRHRK